jgi:hypothetical protein
MPLPRTNAKEPRSSSHSNWGGSLKFVVQPVMSKQPDQPDKWTVSGISRSYASKEHADKVRSFLKKNPPTGVKQALDQGRNVDDMLPSHLQKLPSWDEVHGTPAMKEGLMSNQSMEMHHLLGECEEGCGCSKEKSKKKGPSSAKISAESVFSHLAVSEALEQAKESLECGCFEKMQEARDALTVAMCEAGCPPMQHINRKLGRCTKLEPELHQAVQNAHALSRKSHRPQDHQRSHQAMQDVAKQLQGAGFHQLAGLHVARAHAHKLAAAS